MNGKQHLFEIEIFCNIIIVFTVYLFTYQFGVALQNKSNIFIFFTDL